MSTDKCKSIDKNQGQNEEEKKLRHFLDQTKSRLPVISVNGMDKGEIHLERMNKKLKKKASLFMFCT